MMEESRLLFEISEDIVAGENVSADDLQGYLGNIYNVKGTIFVVCTKGSMEVTLNYGRYIVRENDYITLLDNSFLQLHNVTPDLCFSYAGFSPKIMHEVEFFKKAFDYLFIIFEEPVKRISENLQLYMLRSISLWKMIREVPEIYNNKEVLRSMLGTCIHTSIAMYYQDNLEERWAKSPKNVRMSRQFLKLVAIHYRTERGISFYAKELGTSKENLCRSIKSCTNMTALDVIDYLIIIDAKTQLKSTSTSIKEIGISLGFDNLATFCRFFRRHTGVSPLKYRDK